MSRVMIHKLQRPHPSVAQHGQWRNENTAKKIIPKQINVGLVQQTRTTDDLQLMVDKHGVRAVPYNRHTPQQISHHNYDNKKRITTVDQLPQTQEGGDKARNQYKETYRNEGKREANEQLQKRTMLSTIAFFFFLFHKRRPTDPLPVY